MKRRVTIVASAVMAMALALTGCGSSSSSTTTTSAAAQGGDAQTTAAAEQSQEAAATPTYVWKLGSVDSTSNPNYEAFQHLTELLDEKAPGKWDITIYPDSQLGDAAQMIESVQMGTLELTAPSCSLVAN